MMQQWCLSLPGDPAWWQAFAGIVQAILAIAIFAVTYKYVRLTGALVNLQKQAERREQYERRIKIYDAVMSFLAKFATDMKAELQEITGLNRDTREADFLFGQEVPDLISKVARTALEHRTLRVTKAIELGDVEKIKRNAGLEEWLTTTAWKDAKEVFGRYLKLGEPEVPSK